MTKKFLMIALPRQPGWYPMRSFDGPKVAQAEVDLKEDIADQKSNYDKDEMLLTLSPFIRSFFEDLH